MLVKRSIYLLLVHLEDHLSDQSGDSDCRNLAKERERVIEIGIAMVKSGRDRETESIKVVVVGKWKSTWGLRG